MPSNRRWMAVLVLVGAVALSACGRSEGTATKEEPFQLELINEKTGVNRLTLAEGPAERIGIETEPVAALDGSEHTTIPYSALLYTADGDTWVYTSPERLVFVREPVTVVSIEGNTVVLSDGPPVGTAVVTVGGAELTGMEFGVGK